MSQINPVIYRLQKLLALAAEGSGATEAEAQSAMEKAQAIMAEHNLTMATIAATGEKGSEQRAKEGLDGQAMFEYQRNLMAIIAEVNYCYVTILYKYGRRGSRAIGYQIIGTASNVTSVRVMFEYLANTIDRLVREFNNGDYRLRMSRRSISWCKGCAERLGERIKKRHDDYLAEQKKKAEEARKAAQHPASPSHGALIVVMEDYQQKERDLNNDFRNGWAPGTTEKNRKEREAKSAETKANKIAKAKEEGFDDKVAEAFAEYYFDTPQAAFDWLHGLNQEKNEKYWEKEYQKQRTREDREFRKTDWSAYSKGQEAGNSIGLDAQLSKGSAPKSIK